MCPGTCQAPETCGGGGDANQCGCTPTTCEEADAECGSISDGCGHTIPCEDECTEPETCGGGGMPNRCGCEPATCDELGLECGTVDDGCGGTAECDECEPPAECGIVTPNVCSIPEDPEEPSE